MHSETIQSLMARVQAIDGEVSALRRAIDAEPLAANDRQYLSRCFDLLTMELEALRQYLGGVAA